MQVLLCRSFQITMLTLLTAQLCSCTWERWYKVSGGRDWRDPAIMNFTLLDGSRGWAVASAALLQTSDGGRTWQDRLDLTGPDFLASAVDFADARRGWVGGSIDDQAALIHIRDGTVAWSKQIPELGERLSCLASGESRFMWAVGSKGVGLSEDFGASWKVVLSLTDRDSQHGGTRLDRNGFVVVGDPGELHITLDLGRTWTQRKIADAGRLTAVAFCGRRGVAVGFNAALFTTCDSGQTWQRAEVPSQASLLDVKAFEDEWWVVGADGTILHSAIDGKRWVRVPSATDVDLTCLAFQTGVGGWAGGDNMTVLRLAR